MIKPDYWLKQNFLSQIESQHLFATLENEIAWRQDTIRMFGKEIKIPRLQHFMGDTGIEYRYSNTTLTASEWHPSVDELKQKLETLTQLNFNAVLLNYYRDGKDSMGWHSDDEPELGPDPIIASISLGANRRFLLRNKTDPKQQKNELLLESGSLLWMGPTLQRDWQHSLPRTAKNISPRINLTFRYFPKK